MEKLISGIYKCEVWYDSISMGNIILAVNETEYAFTLKLLKNTVRYDSPQIDDMFANTDTVRIKKSGSKHAINVCSQKRFVLYPYRVGVPYMFDLVR